MSEKGQISLTFLLLALLGIIQKCNANFVDLTHHYKVNYTLGWPFYPKLKVEAQFRGYHDLGFW